MLHPQTNWCERILYFVRDLSRHFTPGENPLIACDFDSAELEVSRQTLRCNATKPERSDSAQHRREQNEDRKIASPSIERELVTSRWRREDISLILRPGRGPITKQHSRLSYVFLPARIQLAMFDDTEVHRHWQRSPRRCELVEKRITRYAEQSTRVKKQWCVVRPHHFANLCAVRLRDNRVEGLAHEELSHITIVGSQSLIRPDRERESRNRKECRERKSEPTAIAANPFHRAGANPSHKSALHQRAEG